MTMTEAPTLNGQVLGQAERATRALLDEVLAETSTPFEQWVALLLLSTTEPQTRDSFERDLADRLRAPASDIRLLVEQLCERGLVDGDAPLTLSDRGVELYETISRDVAEL